MFVDTFHNTMADAMEEVARRRSDPNGAELITRVEPSPYGGFRVRSVPADIWLEMQAGAGLTASPYRGRASEFELL